MNEWDTSVQNMKINIFVQMVPMSWKMPISQKSPQHCLWNGSNVCLTDDGKYLNKPLPTLLAQGNFTNYRPLHSAFVVYKASKHGDQKTQTPQIWRGTEISVKQLQSKRTKVQKAITTILEGYRNLCRKKQTNKGYKNKQSPQIWKVLKSLFYRQLCKAVLVSSTNHRARQLPDWLWLFQELKVLQGSYNVA